MINVDGTGLQRLTETGYVTQPDWSPVGNIIAYEWNIRGNEVYLFNIGSGSTHKLETGLAFTGRALWNNKGTKLLVSGRKTENSQPEIRLLNIEKAIPEVLQTITLNENMISTSYDWYNN